MKKILLSICIFLCGCNSEYISNRDYETEETLIVLIADEKEMLLIENLQINFTDLYICNNYCVKHFNEAKNKYVDGIFVLGDKSIETLNYFDNSNKIPIIEITKENILSYLEENYSNYIWEYGMGNEEISNEYAYIYDNDINVNYEGVFYQENNKNSICELEYDLKQLEKDINNHIDLLVHEQIIKNIEIKYIKK